MRRALLRPLQGTALCLCGVDLDQDKRGKSGKIAELSRFVAFFQVVFGVSQTEGWRAVHRLRVRGLLAGALRPSIRIAIRLLLGLGSRHKPWLSCLRPLSHQDAEIVLGVLK